MGDTTAIIPDDLPGGEVEKIIQLPDNNTGCTEEDATENCTSKPQPESISRELPFQSAPEVLDAIPSESNTTTPNDKPHLG